ncbi:MAG: hypothetical protein ACOCTG_00040 [Bacteroidota bacterium]
MRRELSFVNHVRDQELANVYVFITDQRAGTGGRVYTLSFTGRGVFAGQSHSLEYSSGQTDTDFEQREGLTDMLKVGLVPFLSRTSLATRLRVSVDQVEIAANEDVQDRWNFWVFEAYGGGNFSMESAQSAVNVRYGIFADRVTEQWKIRLRPYFNYNTRTVDSDGERIHRVTRRDGFDSYVIKSVGQHWAVGVFGDYLTSTFHNYRHRGRFSPAVEYSFFPYAQASTRSLTATYRIGYEASDYLEETIYGEIEQGVGYHSVGLEFRLRQPWGSIYTGVHGSQYLHDTDHYRVSLNSNFNLRLVRGLGLNVSTRFQRIHDQIGLAKGEATLEEILLQQRSLATSYYASGSVGLTYTFGSIYNNVVNTRL